jgi:hypothetical protein
MCLRFKDSRLLDSGLGTRDGLPGFVAPPIGTKKSRRVDSACLGLRVWESMERRFTPPTITLIINNLQMFSIKISIDLKLQK